MTERRWDKFDSPVAGATPLTNETLRQILAQFRELALAHGLAIPAVPAALKKPITNPADGFGRALVVHPVAELYDALAEGKLTLDHVSLLRALTIPILDGALAIANVPGVEHILRRLLSDDPTLYDSAKFELWTCRIHASRVAIEVLSDVGDAGRKPDFRVTTPSGQTVLVECASNADLRRDEAPHDAELDRYLQKFALEHRPRRADVRLKTLNSARLLASLRRSLDGTGSRQPPFEIDTDEFSLRVSIPNQRISIEDARACLSSDRQVAIAAFKRLFPDLRSSFDVRFELDRDKGEYVVYADATMSRVAFAGDEKRVTNLLTRKKDHKQFSKRDANVLYIELSPQTTYRPDISTYNRIIESFLHGNRNRRFTAIVLTETILNQSPSKGSFYGTLGTSYLHPNPYKRLPPDFPLFFNGPARSQPAQQPR